MKQVQNLCFSGFLLLCAICSAVVIFLYPRIQFSSVTEFDEVNYELTESIEWLILGKMQQMDPSYRFIHSSDPVLEQNVNDAAQNSIRESIYLLDNDENFAYRIEWNDKVLSNHFDEESNAKNALFYGELIYDENGNLRQSGNMDATEFSFLSLYNFYTLDGIVSNLMTDYDEDVELNPPTDLKVTLFIPKEMKTGGLVYTSVYNDSVWVPFVLLALLISSFVIGVYLLLISWKILAKTQFFKTILSWKAEFNIFFFGTLTILVISVCMYIMGVTINDILLPAMVRYGLPAAGVWVNIINFCLFFLSLFFIGIDIYYVKYSLCSGFVRFLKEDTWLGNRIMELYGGIKDLSNYDLDQKIKSLILKGVLLNTVLMFLCALFWGWLLVLIYGVVSYIFLLHQAQRIVKEYDKLLVRLDRIAQGDFKVDDQYQTSILPSLQEKLDTVQEDFEEAIKERVRSQNLRTELITNVSHDLKTPLTGIKSYLELLNDSQLSAEDKEEYLIRLNQYTDRLSKLIEDLFEVSKANSGNIQLETQNVDIVSLVEQVLVENETMLEKKGLSPVIRKPEEPILCLLDGDKTVRIFENLLSNVAKYALENTRVFVTMEKNQDTVDITIQNISKTPLDFDPHDITERFVRADQSRHEEGSGLGLAIVKSFCEIQNGSFTVQLDGDVFKAIVQFKTI
ncbi:HAMP domain-containing sensor histidine kinase [Faecalicoccus pleomorphus]|uniref:sensor histidine kinase n=1 Tax=Faecalicoccus pleomorphus TaxID=1323 RepID=UPI002331551D|nr:HAMP domain-containing sensor histidine kinase [Faecalicoccus pleomorphus]MDB7986284.1 HAMP domain-containing sensor histidine kinase [Faecalicoccus pleomorphus]MDB7990268.1 HAMP domain-containing sensor histidine kinase [Faecalicoccus pleomorphus]